MVMTDAEARGELDAAREQIDSLQQEGDTMFLDLIHEQAAQLGLPEDVPPGEDRRHLALLMAMYGLNRPDAGFYSAYDAAHHAGAQTWFFNTRLANVSGLPPQGQFGELAMMQSTVLFGLGPGAYMNPGKSSAVEVRGNRTIPRAVGDRERITYPPEFGALPGGEAEAARVLALTRAGQEFIIGTTRKVLLQLAQRIYGASYAACAAVGANDLAGINLSLTNPNHLDALSRLWSLILSMNMEGLDIDREVEQIRRAFQDLEPFGTIGDGEAF